MFLLFCLFVGNYIPLLITAHLPKIMRTTHDFRHISPSAPPASPPSNREKLRLLGCHKAASKQQAF